MVLGSTDPRVVGLARDECERLGARLVEVGAEAKTVGAGTVPYSVTNVKLGIRAARRFWAETWTPSPGKRSPARTSGVLPARFERHEVRGVPVVVDGGHNPEGLAAALASVRVTYGGRPLGVVFGALRDKDIGRYAYRGKKRGYRSGTHPALERAGGGAGLDLPRVGSARRSGRRATGHTRMWAKLWRELWRI